MSRPKRFEYEGAFAHVINRGNRREKIFRDDEDYQRFESLLLDKSKSCHIHVYAWCLMPNHFHLLVETPEANLSIFMRRLLTSYAQQFNKKHNLVGHVFQGRYKAVMCDQDAFFLQLVRYIHLNPIQVKGRPLVQTLDAWPWSSHRYYLSANGPPSVQEFIDRVLIRFGGKRHLAIKAYKQFLKEGLHLGHLGDFDQLSRSGILGCEDFVEHVKEKCRTPIRNKKRSSKIYSVEGLAAVTSTLFQVPLNEFRSHDKKRNLRSIRQAFAFVGRKYARLSATALAGYLGRDVSVISQMVGQVEQIKITAEVRQLISHLEGNTD